MSLITLWRFNKVRTCFSGCPQLRVSNPGPCQTDLIAGVDFTAQENTIRDLINQEVPIRTVLRLLSIYSIISGGLKPKVLEEFKREILQVGFLASSDFQISP